LLQRGTKKFKRLLKLPVPQSRSNWSNSVSGSLGERNGNDKHRDQKDSPHSTGEHFCHYWPGCLAAMHVNL
jgi:hypothetical protein